MVEKNKLEECYLRPMVLRGYGAAGMNPVGSPVETLIACWPWGAYLTPAIDGTLLSGITRDSVITIAGELGISVREQSVPREALYAADELFFTGTAAEVTPIAQR